LKLTKFMLEKVYLLLKEVLKLKWKKVKINFNFNFKLN
jgi:hypothetical protein